MDLLNIEERRDLQDWLLTLLEIRGGQARSQLLDGLPDALRWRVPLEANLHDYVWTIVDIAQKDSARLEDGTWPILTVLDNAIRMAGTLALKTNFQALHSTLKANIPTKLPVEFSGPAGDVAWLQFLRERTRADLEELRKATATLASDPGWIRLNALVRPQSLSGIVLPELRRISLSAPVLKLLSTREATDWLDTARTLAAAAVDNLKLCYQQLDALIGMPTDGPERPGGLHTASLAIGEACRKGDELLAHFDSLLQRRAGAAGRPDSAGRLRQLRELLLRCDEHFDTNRDLRALFADERIAPFSGNVPEAESRSARVDRLIAYLNGKRNVRGEAALPTFLQVLAERYDPSDVRYDQLLNLAREFDTAAA
jgi:hypothetical protein